MNKSENQQLNNIQNKRAYILSNIKDIGVFWRRARDSNPRTGFDLLHDFQRFMILVLLRVLFYM